MLDNKKVFPNGGIAQFNLPFGVYGVLSAAVEARDGKVTVTASIDKPAITIVLDGENLKITPRP